jgi:hypothetical protein
MPLSVLKNLTPGLCSESEQFVREDTFGHFKIVLFDRLQLLNHTVEAINGGVRFVFIYFIHLLSLIEKELQFFFHIPFVQPEL